MRLLAVYAAVTLLPVLALGFALVGGYRSEAHTRGLTEARSEAALLAGSVVEPQLEGRPVGTLTPTAAADLHRVVARSVAAHQILRLRLRDLAGHVVFADDGSGFGGAPEDEAMEAARGETVAKLTHFNSDSNDTGPVGVSAVEVYLPLNADGHTLGVLEVYLPYDPIAHDISAGLRRLSWQLGIGLALLYVVLTGVSVSLTRRLRREARHNRFLARHDPLTSLPNRVLFREQAAAAVAAATREGRRCAVAVIDLDRFKEVNDTLGHHSGDALLLELSKRLAEHAAEGIIIARLGGDEFGVVVPNVKDQVDATGTMFALRLILEEDVQVRHCPSPCRPASVMRWYPTTEPTSMS